VLHPEDRDRVLAAQEEARRAGEPLTHDYRIITEADEMRWLREKSVAVRGRDGLAIYRQGFVTDITEEKQAADRLEREFVLRQALIDASIDAICLTTRDGELVLGNMPMAQLALELELPMQGTVQERLLAIADRMTEPDRYRETIRSIAADTDVPRRDEFELRGTGRFFQGFASPVIEDGAFLGRIWTLREVTEERRLERQQLSFVASVSHELRTPLTSILGYADLLGEVLGPLEATPERYLAVIARNASRLQALVDELLFVAQVDAGRFELDLAEIELAELAAASYEAALPLAESRSLELSLSIEARPTLTADPVRLGQAIDNLVSNAIKFTPDNGKVDIRITATDGSAIVAVTDTGVGIPKSELSRVGERFFRSSTAGELAIGGTGLGMAIVKMIAEAHQGRVRLDSEPGRGTTVTLELPMQRA
jgi:signal transduction histidine kinase